MVAYTGDHDAAWKLMARRDAWLPYGCTVMVVDSGRWYPRDGTTDTIDPFGSVAAQAKYVDGWPRRLT